MPDFDVLSEDRVIRDEVCGLAACHGSPWSGTADKVIDLSPEQPNGSLDGPRLRRTESFALY